jgi:hypothetical protein
MTLRSSGGYDADNVVSQRVSDKEHPAVDYADSIEAQLAGRFDVIELDQIRVQEHPGGSFEVDAVFLPIGLRFGAVPLEIHCLPPERQYTDIQ